MNTKAIAQCLYTRDNDVLILNRPTDMANGLVYLSNGEIVDRYTTPMTLTVEYHARDGQVFSLVGIKWYEMQAAFNELSRLSYERNTSVKYVKVF